MISIDGINLVLSTVLFKLYEVIKLEIKNLRIVPNRKLIRDI